MAAARTAGLTWNCKNSSNAFRFRMMSTIVKALRNSFRMIRIAKMNVM